jgi:hypothetical protein
MTKIEDFDRRQIALCRAASAPGLHVVSFADLDECGDAGARPREPSQQPANPLDPCPRAARLRIFRPQRSYREGRGLQHLPRADRQNGADASDPLLAYPQQKPAPFCAMRA